MDEQITVTLDDETAAFVADRVDEGRFADASAVMRAAVKALAEKEAQRAETLEAIKKRVAKSLADPRPTVPIDQAFRRIKDQLRSEHGVKS